MEVFDHEKIRTKATYSRWRNGKQSPKSKTEGKRKERRLSVFVLKCVAKSLSVHMCLHVYVSYPGFLSEVCGILALISPLEQSGTGRLAGWLAGCTGKETVSIKQQMEDSMCLHCRNTHIHAGMHTCILTHTGNYVQIQLLLLTV